MKWFNRIIANIAPVYAIRREMAQRSLERLERLAPRMKRSFEAVSGNRLRHDFLSPKNSADSALAGADSLRHHVRQMEYNNGFVSGPISRIVNNVVGVGFRFQSRVTADDDPRKAPFPTILQDDADLFNYEMERGFRLWSKKADKRLILDFNDILRIVEGALLRDGEALVIGRESRRRDRTIPYCLEVLEIDRLTTPLEEIRNPKIRNGIRYDDEGVPEAYFVLKNHPGEQLVTARTSKEIEEVKAFNPNGTLIPNYHYLKVGKSLVIIVEKFIEWMEEQSGCKGTG